MAESTPGFVAQSASGGSIRLSALGGKVPGFLPQADDAVTKASQKCGAFLLFAFLGQSASGTGIQRGIRPVFAPKKLPRRSSRKRFRQSVPSQVLARIF